MEDGVHELSLNLSTIATWCGMSVLNEVELKVNVIERLKPGVKSHSLTCELQIFISLLDSAKK